MKSLAWTGRLRERFLPRGDGIRRATVQLAALTVMLVLVMLIALEGVVYVITQQTLLNSLETTLKQQTHISDQSIRFDFRLSGGSIFPIQPGTGASNQSGPGERDQPIGRGPGGRRGFIPEHGAGDTSSVFVTRNNKIVHSDGVLGRLLLNPGEASEAFFTGTADCCDVTSYRGADYLIYTAPVRTQGHIVGVQQVSISETQYQETLTLLLRSLLVVAMLGLLLAGLISAALVRRAMRPIHLAVQRQRDFVADAAHELRTPLAIMRTTGEVGLASTSPEDLQETVAQMLSENQHLTRLVEDLSLLARADTQTVTVARERLDLSNLVQETANEIRFLVEDREVVLETDVAPGVQVYGDALRLRQLLLILLDNALKHTPDGGQVRVSLRPAGTRASLQVVDSGPGIDPESLPHIFDRFYRADTARSGEGNGLGLAIGRWIVEAHAGQIGAENTAPHGATFTVLLPTLRSHTATV